MRPPVGPRGHPVEVSHMEKRRQHDRRPRPLGGGAIARTGGAEACLAALENPGASLTPSAIARIAARFGHLGAVREALLVRPDLPPVVRLLLVRQLSGALASFATSSGWLARNRAEQMQRETCEKAAVTIAALHPDDDIRPLIRHLQMNGELTSELILRALQSGQTAMFECALAERAALPLRQVQALVRHGAGTALRTLFDRAGLPASVSVALCQRLRHFAADAPGERPAANDGRPPAKRRRIHAGRIRVAGAA
jgi:uncharacterized protein (DUF2336 family)